MFIIAIPIMLLLLTVPAAIIYAFARAGGVNHPLSLKTAIITTLGIPISLSIYTWVISPTTPTKSDIIGTYIIDTSKYPGKNANWQHATYTIEITKTHLTVHDARTPTTFTYPIEWRYNYKWNFKNPDQKRHHLVRSEPTITRHPFSHTYTFQSPLYKTIFLKKK